MKHKCDHDNHVNDKYNSFHDNNNNNGYLSAISPESS